MSWSVLLVMDGNRLVVEGFLQQTRNGTFVRRDGQDQRASTRGPRQPSAAQQVQMNVKD
jgi:hypothetical protein